MPELKVVLTLRVDYVHDRKEIRESIDSNFVKLFRSLAMMPFFISNFGGKDYIEYYLNSVEPDLLVLSGGGDFDTFKERLDSERAILDWAKARRIAVLGVCRGMQALCLYEGVGLRRVRGHVGCRHEIVWLDAEREDDLPRIVNSYHEFCVNECPSEYSRLAHGLGDTSEFCIEAIHHNSLPWEGWMFHPERDFLWESAGLRRRILRLIGRVGE